MFKCDIKHFTYCFSFLFLFLSGCQFETNKPMAELSESLTQSQQNDIKFTKQLLVDNLNYVDNEDIDGYLETIPLSAHEDTKKAMINFFEEYSVTHDLLEFEVVERKQDRLIARTKQKTTGTADHGGEEYRDHIASMLHTFEKEQGQWKIVESSTTDVKFLD